jgi:hypothetical protein
MLMEGIMTHRPISEFDETTGRGADLFAIGAVLCAAVIVALFALHGGPNLLGERFNMGAITLQAE